MILDILEHTPVWVWIVFGALVLLGLQQSRTRDVSIARATILPVVMIVLSLSGVVGAFGPVPFALAAWAAGVGLSLTLAGKAVAVRGASRSTQPGHLRIPGSFVPVMLIMAVFITKYSAGVALAINPSLAANTAVAVTLSLVYGVFSGLFWSRPNRCARWCKMCSHESLSLASAAQCWLRERGRPLHCAHPPAAHRDHAPVFNVHFGGVLVLH